MFHFSRSSTIKTVYWIYVSALILTAGTNQRKKKNSTEMMTHHSFEASGLEIWNTCTICDRRAEWPEVNVISDVSNQHDCAADASLTSLIVIGSIYGFSWRGRENTLNMSSFTAKEKQCLHLPIAIIIIIFFGLKHNFVKLVNFIYIYIFQLVKIFKNLTAFYWNAAHCTLKMMEFKLIIYKIIIHFHCWRTFVSQQSCLEILRFIHC